MWEPKKIERHEGYYSVSLKNPSDGKIYWVDIEIVNNDIEADWNQYIFHLTNLDDIEREAMQRDCNNFDDATGTAICYLESNGYIYQDSNGNWFDKEEI